MNFLTTPATAIGRAKAAVKMAETFNIEREGTSAPTKEAQEPGEQAPEKNS